MVDMDLIEKCVSPWASPVVIVAKPDGGHRMTQDLRQINVISRTDSYPMHRIDEILAAMDGAVIFSSIDISKGYWQIPVALEDRDKTAFYGPDGLYRCKRAPFGEKNSGATFQRAMDTVLAGLLWKNCLSFVDDVYIYSSSIEQHFHDIFEVFSAITKAGFTINPKKVKLFQTVIKFLGFIIEKGKHRPDPEKLEKLQNYPIPKSQKTVQRFLGFIGFYRHFYDHFERIARPLNRLLGKETKFVWSSDCQEAFETLRNGLTSFTFLYMPRLDEQFIVTCDAASGGLGATLANYREGLHFPIWFASKSLNSAQKNYSTTEQECLAVIWAIRKFKAFLEYTHFIVETDHQALVWLMKIKDPIGRLARWALELQGYDFEMRYRKGSSNHAADALSRLHEISFLDSEIITKEELRAAQASDPLLAKVIQSLSNRTDSADKQVVKLCKEARVSSDGILLKFVGSNVVQQECSNEFGWKIWVPKSLVPKVLKLHHDSILAGHMSQTKSLYRIADRFWWK